MGKGAGDIYIKAECMFVSKTYSIQDIDFYDSMTSSNTHWSIPSAVSSSSIFGYSSDGWKFGNASSYSSIYNDLTLTGDKAIEFQLNDYNTGSSSGLVLIQTNTSKSGVIGLLNFNGSTLIINGQSTSHTFAKGSIVRVELLTNQIKVYDDDTLVNTVSANLSDPYFIRFDTSSSRYCEIKDFKIIDL